MNQCYYYPRRHNSVCGPPYIRLTSGAKSLYPKVDHTFCLTCWNLEPKDFWIDHAELDISYYDFKYLPLELII